MKRGSRLRRQAQGLLPFDYEEVAQERRVTSYAGLALVAETYRASGAGAAVRRCVQTRARQRERGLSDEQTVESFALLLAAGGDCNDDFDRLRADAGLAAMVGHELPSPTRAKEFLYAFHQETQDAAVAAQRFLTPAFVPAESAPLAGLHEALRATAQAAQVQQPADRATIDLDATIIESEKRQAAPTYTGERGYQPVVAYWAEQEMILAEEFRDGNVPAGTDLLRVLQRAVATLPAGLERLYLRADSAAYEHRLLDWCRAERDGAPRLIFAISADMSRELRQVCERVPRQRWALLERQAGVERCWAEVEFVPSAPSIQKGKKPDRYLAIRLRHEQGDLFADGSEIMYFAVVTNDWARDGAAILDWQRQRAGTIEKVHDVLKNELGAGVLPCARFGANAAWFRLTALTFNLLSLLRRAALPKDLAKARPKRLRFRVLCLAGEIVHHARQLLIRVGGTWLRRGVGLLGRARLRLRQLARRLACHPPPRPQPV